MKSLFLFDIDGVLCDNNTVVNPKFQSWFIDWVKSNNHTIYYVTGSNREKTLNQIGEEMLNLATISFHCLGNSIWIDGNESVINNFVFNDEENQWLQNKIDQSPFPIKTGNHIEFRNGSVNFSIVGRNANIEQRNLYKEYDLQTKERLNIIREFTDKFPYFEAFIGGNISIDICLRGANKGLIFTYIPLTKFDKIYAFGDKGMKYGVDYPLSKYKNKIYKYFQITSGFVETYSILNSL